MFHKIDNNGYYLGVSKETNDGMEFYTEVQIVGNFIKFKFDGKAWIEGASTEEIADLLQQKKQIANELLKETDWYITRFAETGKEIPKEILELRQQIRDNA
jgi:hypothetical protein